MKNTASNSEKSAGVCLAWIKQDTKAGVCLAWIDPNESKTAATRPSVSLNLETLL